MHRTMFQQSDSATLTYASFRTVSQKPRNMVKKNGHGARRKHHWTPTDGIDRSIFFVRESKPILSFVCTVEMWMLWSKTCSIQEHEWRNASICFAKRQSLESLKIIASNGNARFKKPKRTNSYYISILFVQTRLYACLWLQRPLHISEYIERDRIHIQMEFCLIYSKATLVLSKQPQHKIKDK